MNSTSTILLIENDSVDVMTVRRALRELKVPNPVLVAHNGEEGLAVLNDPSKPGPGLILLDLNMPRMNGIEFLRVIRADERFRRLPVVILTTSRQENDRLQSFNLGVAGYIIKPVDYQDFVEAMRRIEQYWSLCETAP